MGVARFYVSENNESGASFDGVPLRDIEQEEWDRYPAWLQASVDASPMYRKTKPDSAPRRAASKPDDEPKET
jgi:hypothetical protein